MSTNKWLTALKSVSYYRPTDFYNQEYEEGVLLASRISNLLLVSSILARSQALN